MLIEQIKDPIPRSNMTKENWTQSFFQITDFKSAKLKNPLVLILASNKDRLLYYFIVKFTLA